MALDKSAAVLTDRLTLAMKVWNNFDFVDSIFTIIHSQIRNARISRCRISKI